MLNISRVFFLVFFLASSTCAKTGLNNLSIVNSQSKDSISNFIFADSLLIVDTESQIVIFNDDLLRIKSLPLKGSNLMKAVKIGQAYYFYCLKPLVTSWSGAVLEYKAYIYELVGNNFKLIFKSESILPKGIYGFAGNLYMLGSDDDSNLYFYTFDKGLSKFLNLGSLPDLRYSSSQQYGSDVFLFFDDTSRAHSGVCDLSTRSTTYVYKVSTSSSGLDRLNSSTNKILLSSKFHNSKMYSYGLECNDGIFTNCRKQITAFDLNSREFTTIKDLGAPDDSCNTFFYSRFDVDDDYIVYSNFNSNSDDSINVTVNSLGISSGQSQVLLDYNLPNRVSIKWNLIDLLGNRVAYMLSYVNRSTEVTSTFYNGLIGASLSELLSIESAVFYVAFSEDSIAYGTSSEVASIDISSAARNSLVSISNSANIFDGFVESDDESKVVFVECSNNELANNNCNNVKSLKAYQF